MRPFSRPLLALLPAAVLGLSVASLVAAPGDEDGPIIHEHEDGYTYQVVTYEASSEIDFDENDAEHAVEMTLRVSAPAGLDAVCLRLEPPVEGAYDQAGENLYLPPRRRGPEDLEDIEYIAFVNGRTVIEVKDTALSRPAYTVQRMVVAGEAVLAEERGEFEMSAIVTDDELETPFNASVRLSEMKIGRDHMAELVIEFDREPGQDAPMPEAVFALDQAGNVLGGGPWTEGTSIFAGRGKFEAEFLVTDDADVTALRLVFLTEYRVVPVELEVTGVFQR